MTVEEIKEALPMRQVIESYGLSVNKKGFCKCPFHGRGNERTASMKIYDKSYYCFACGASGDVFTFTQQMENISFKDAYISLGGEYRFTSDREKKRIIAKRQREQQNRERQKIAEEQFRNRLRDTITGIQLGLEIEKPFSDNWCLLMNAKPKFIYWWNCLLDGREIGRLDVFRAISKLNQGYDIG